MSVTGTEPTPYEVVLRSPTLWQVTLNMRWTDIAIWWGLGAVGMLYGRSTGRPKRVAAMWMGGTLGWVGGYLFAVQSSAARLMGWRENDIERKRYAKRYSSAKDS
jgi:hypothetical protein